MLLFSLPRSVGLSIMKKSDPDVSVDVPAYYEAVRSTYLITRFINSGDVSVHECHGRDELERCSSEEYYPRATRQGSLSLDVSSTSLNGAAYTVSWIYDNPKRKPLKC